LRQIFRLRAVPRKPVANVVDAARMTAHKFLPGRPVALEALLDQLGILLQRFKSLKTASWSILPPPRLRFGVTGSPAERAGLHGRPDAIRCRTRLHHGLPNNGTKSACKKFPEMRLAPSCRPCCAHLTEAAPLRQEKGRAKELS